MTITNDLLMEYWHLLRKFDRKDRYKELTTFLLNALPPHPMLFDKNTKAITRITLAPRQAARLTAGIFTVITNDRALDNLLVFITKRDFAALSRLRTYLQPVYGVFYGAPDNGPACLFLPHGVFTFPRTEPVPPPFLTTKDIAEQYNLDPRRIREMLRTWEGDGVSMVNNTYHIDPSIVPDIIRQLLSGQQAS
jgi:hypothetical protein